MERNEVYKLIDSERWYQDLKWGGTAVTKSGGHHYTPEEWIIYMEDYLAEAKHYLSRESQEVSYDKAMNCIRKVTALGVAAMEHIQTNSREEEIFHTSRNDE